VRFLLDRGYRGATVHQAIHSPPAARTFALTFDDAYRSVYLRAYPILSALGVPATAFVATDFPDAGTPMAWPGIDHWIGSEHEPELTPASWEELRALAARGWEVVLVARREDRLKDLADELSTKHGVRAEVVAADLADPASRDAMIDTVAQRGLVVDVLVNNAGLSTAGKVHETERAAALNMIRINIEALSDLCHVYLPGMVERGAGAVLNVASTAAFQPIPGQSGYAATKAFVLSLSEAAHEELKGTGVTVTAVCPGPVRTEFMEVAGLDQAEQQVPDFVWTSPAEIAEAAVQAAEKGKRTVVPGLLNRAGAVTGHYTPRALALPIVKRVWRLSL
jgi:short-subunit dehydrogenase